MARAARAIGAPGGRPAAWRADRPVRVSLAWLAVGLCAGSLLAQPPPPTRTVPPAARARVLRVPQTPVVRPMPDLVGRPLEQARIDPMVRRLELTLADVGEPNPTRPPGIIVRQEIPAGDPVPPGATVRVWVAVPEARPESPPESPPEPPLEPRTAEMPSLEGRLLREAVGDVAVIRLRLILEARDDRESSEPPGTIVWQLVPPGDRVEVGATVVVRVARGVVVPRVLDAPVEVARDVLDRASLRAAEDVVETTRSPARTVFGQDPPPGSRVARGSVVRIAVASAPPVIPDEPRPEEGGGGWPAWLAGAGLAVALALLLVRARTGVRERATARQPDVRVEPQADAGAQALEVSGRSLADVEIVLAPTVDAGRQRLEVDGPLVGKERRLYE